MSIQDLRPGPQDKSDFYLENIFQLLADPNVSRASISSTLPKPPPFSPPRYAVWVNLLWFSSLAISITSALLATLIQQWTRRYIKVTQPLGSPHKRARIRQHIISGPHNMHFLWATDAVPTLLHLSVFLFFAGLLVLLRNIDHTVFDAVAVWVVLCVSVYAFITFLPIFHPASPHYSPLSSLVWHIYTYIVVKPVSLFKKGIQKIDCPRPPRLLIRLEKKVEEHVKKESLAPKLDAQILESFFDTLVEDCAQEKYFEAIPGFYNSGSRVVQIQNVKQHFTEKFKDKFRHSVDQFLDRSLSSNSFCESTRTRRLLTCLKATHTVLVDNQNVDTGKTATDRIVLSRNWDALPPSHEIRNILQNWHDSDDRRIATMGISTIARIIASVGSDDETWKALTTMMLPLWEAEIPLEGVDLKDGHNVFLANLIYTTRSFFKRKLPLQNILHSISGFDVQKTDHKLKRGFCDIWNVMVQDVGTEWSSSDLFLILREINRVYNDLHPTSPIDVDASTSFPPSYSSCQCSRTQSYDPSLPTYSQQDTAPPTNEHTTEHDTPHASSQQITVVTMASSSSQGSPHFLTSATQGDQRHYHSSL